MSTHVSVIEIAAFLRSSKCDEEFEAHVSSCPRCGALLQQKAKQHLEPLERPSRIGGFMVLLSTTAVLLALLAGMRAPQQLDPISAAPEGVHGISPVQTPMTILVNTHDDAGLGFNQ
jgi:predicted amidophosphoribosyltransferase